MPAGRARKRRPSPVRGTGVRGSSSCLETCVAGEDDEGRSYPICGLRFMSSGHEGMAGPGAGVAPWPGRFAPAGGFRTARVRGRSLVRRNVARRAPSARTFRLHRPWTCVCLTTLVPLRCSMVGRGNHPGPKCLTWNAAGLSRSWTGTVKSHPVSRMDSWCRFHGTREVLAAGWNFVHGPDRRKLSQRTDGFVAPMQRCLRSARHSMDTLSERAIYFPKSAACRINRGLGSRPLLSTIRRASNHVYT